MNSAICFVRSTLKLPATRIHLILLKANTFSSICSRTSTDKMNILTGRARLFTLTKIFGKNLSFGIQGIKFFKPSAVRFSKSNYRFASVFSAVLIVKALSDKNKKSIIKEADTLYDANKFDELYEILNPHRKEKEPEILWRLARALFEKCRFMDNVAKLASLEEALSLVDEALQLDDNCWAAHKWRAILLDYVWRYKSTKERIVHSFDVRKHMERAISLNPEDSTTYYLLGEWCYTFADMPWYQRKIAATIFASPPTSTYEEALKYFQKAEEISPLFYSMNLLMLAKCLLKLNNQEKAIAYLKQAVSYPIKTADDRQAHNEAAKLLKELKVDN